jgi:alpha-L-rhamnosidase
MNEKLLDKEKGLYRTERALTTMHFMPPCFLWHLVLHRRLTTLNAREFLISKGMACSPYGTPYLFDALYKMGAEDYAFELLTSETDRSWMNMIRFGTTITSEAWDIKIQEEHDMEPCLGCCTCIYYNQKYFWH